MADDQDDALNTQIPAPGSGGDDWDEGLTSEESRARGKELDHSRRLDVHRWSDHPEVNAFVDPIYAKHFSGGNERIRKQHLKVILLDLYVAWCDDPTLRISLSKNNIKYKAKSIYNELHISKVTPEIINVLHKVGLIEHALGFRNPEIKYSRETRIWPTEKLISLFRDARFSQFDIGSHRDRIAVILRVIDPDDKKAKEVEYEPTEETERMEETLARYNALLERTYIDIPTLISSSIEAEKDGKPHILTVSQNNKFVRRIFNRNSFEAGGRFWGGWWQRCPKEWRSKIFLNDTPTNEVDFSGLHIVMLYAELGVDYWEEIGEDPYLIPRPDFLDNDKQCRAVAKSLMLVLINAKDEKTAYSAFRDNADTGSAEKHLTNDQLAEVLASLEKKHPAIAKHFASDAGIRLMNKDAQISEIVIDTFVGRNIPTLCLHDSYIVPVGYEDFLIETMAHAFESVMDAPLIQHKDVAMGDESERIEDMRAGLMSWMPYENLPWQKEQERSYLERTNPIRSDRYTNSWNAYREWLDNR